MMYPMMLLAPSSICHRSRSQSPRGASWGKRRHHSDRGILHLACEVPFILGGNTAFGQLSTFLLTARVVFSMFGVATADEELHLSLHADNGVLSPSMSTTFYFAPRRSS